MNVIRFRRVFTRCECTPQFSGARCEVCEFIYGTAKDLDCLLCMLYNLFICY